MEGFFLRVLTASSDQLRQAWEELDGKTHTYTGYDMPFVSKDGSFELGGLPEGAARAQVIPFEGRRYEHGNLKDVSLAAGQAASLDFQLTGKDVFYGRVLFEDGTPAVIRPAPWPGAATRILLARSRTYRAPGVSEVDAQRYFAVYLDEGGREELASGQLRLSISLPAAQEHRFNTVGDFPVDKLSQDRSQAGVIQVKRPESPTPAPTEKPHAIDESLATNTPENVKPADSQAWYVMWQVNDAPLLPGLTQQLLKVLQPARQDDVMWREVAGGGSLKLDVKVEQETGREIVVGLFQDAKWSQEPVAVRLLPKEGTYTLTGLPAGRYQIGAMIGRAPSAAALGVQKIWPEAIEVRPGQTAEAQLLVSREIGFNASGWYNREVSRDYIGDWSLLNENHLLQGRLTGPDGAPIPFGRVSVREYEAVRTDSIAAPELGTNEAGVYKFDGMKWPYRVSATWSDTLPDLLGCRHQHKTLNRVFEGPQWVDFQFDRFPAGTAQIAGRVVDEQGAAVTMFRLQVRTLESSTLAGTGGMPDSDGGVSTTYEYVVPFLSADGSFALSGLPAGRVAVNALAFDYRPYRHEKEKEVVLAAGKTTDIHFEMIHNQRFYGRVLFEDGRPAVARPVPWEGAKTTIRIDETRPFGLAGLGRTRHDVAEVDAGGRFCVYLPDPELEGLRSGTATLRIRLPGKHKDEWQSGGTFPFEKLAEDQAQAGTVTIQRPEYLKAPAVPIATEKAAFPIELSSVGSPEETLKARQLYLNPDADPFLRELRRRTVEYANARTPRARREVVSPLSSSETACSSAVSTLA